MKCARYLEECLVKWVACEQATNYDDLKGLIVMKQSINVADEELLPVLKEKRFKSLKEAATWADDDYVLAHRPVPTSGG